MWAEGLRHAKEGTTEASGPCSIFSRFNTVHPACVMSDPYSHTFANIILHSMETSDLHSLVEDLTTNVDDLETALAPLTQKSLSTTSSKLPLLDKAKLHVFATYALESILFNILRLQGTDAKSHPVFAELSRVKEYFAKIKSAEMAGTKPTTRVDKDAAGRFIRAGLAGNDRIDRERAERIAKEKSSAKKKADQLSGMVGTHARFEGAAKRIKADDAETSGVVPVEPMDVARLQQDDSDDGDSEGGVALGEGTKAKKRKHSDKSSDAEKKAEKRKRRQESKLAKLSPSEGNGSAQGKQRDVDEDDDESEPDVRSHKKPKKSKAPKSSAEALDALLDGTASKLEKRAKKKKKKSKGQKLEDERADEMK